MRRIAVPERSNWIETAKAYGFTFHNLDGQPYWDESACFAFTLDEIERDIEEPSRALHALCLDLAEDASRDERLLTRLGVPAAFHDYVAQSWRQRDPSVLGRFDLAYAGKGPAKLLEYNADTPTSLYETAVFQWLWLEEAQALGLVDRDSDQFNSLHERLVEAYRRVPDRSLLHFTGDGASPEDHGTILYMMDCAAQAGHRVAFLDITAIGRDAEGRFTDLEDRVIDTLAKLYPWEWLFTEEFGPLIPRSNTLFVEPPWKAMLSSKAILPLLWERHPGHPNLLPAYFEGDPRVGELGDHVRKPVFSREGANVRLVRQGEPVADIGGPYAEGARWILQEAADLFASPHGHAVIGSWIVGEEACGVGIREDASPITMNTSRFLPHIIAEG